MESFLYQLLSHFILSIENLDESLLSKQFTTFEVYSIYKKYDENGDLIV